MTKIAPFKALRPVRDKVHLVATRPYYSYKKNVLKAKLEDNPYTFLRIINPEFDKTVRTKPNSRERFELVQKKYVEFIQEGILIQEDTPHFYVYRQTKDNQAFTGIIAGASVQEYNNDLIKKHEATLTSREHMFTNYLDIVGYNAEPVLLAHPSNVNINSLTNRIIQNRPEYEFTTTDRIKHELWLVDTELNTELIQAFEEIPAVYIADGHHRSASSAGLKNIRSNNPVSHNNEDYFLAFFIDEARLKILEFNRIIQSLNNLKTTDFINLLQESFEVKKLDKARKPIQEHEFTMCLDSSWYSLLCKPSVIESLHPVRSLDAEILTLYVLDPILDIKDLKTDDRIEFISGAETIDSIEEKVLKGKAAVAFILYPATMEQVKRVADNQLIMPPKSTWVEPKLRSGLTIYPINE